LPWAPLLSLVSAGMLRRRLRDSGSAEEPTRLPGLWRGLVVGCAALLLFDLPVSVTRMSLQLAVDDEPRVQQRGLAWLRWLGHEPTLRRACYGRSRSAANMDVIGWIVGAGREPSADEARQIYYRLTGNPFNSRPAPEVRTARGAFAELDEWTWDGDQGGEQVGGRLKGLTLLSSRLDAVVDANAATSYAEWIFEFKNDARQTREARAQILLPPGGVVSRLTLWINGEEREAAFGGRGQTRQAYQEVAIQQRRDPVLVTTAGPDRVLMQCFPVPADGGVMKVRLGITAPLRMETLESGEFRWPCFLERNFTIPPARSHSVWLESQNARRLVAADLMADEPKPGIHGVHGTLLDTDLAAGTAVVRVERDPGRTNAWTQTRDQQAVIRQTLGRHPQTPRPRLVLVVDGSRGMASHLEALAKGVAALPDDGEIVLMLAADWETPGSRQAASPALRPAAAADRLRNLATGGGVDNLPALERAWDLAATNGTSAVVWVHAAQPVLLGSTEGLRQRYERRASGPPLFAVQVSPGPNRVLEQLDGIARIQWVPAEADLAAGFARWLGAVMSGSPLVTAVRERIASDAGSLRLAPEEKASSHVERLWALEEVARLRAARNVDEAILVAGTHQLVTPVSGAVVLETAAQYARHGLTPVSPTTVPSIPEPATWALMLGGLAALLFSRWRFRRA
ncbi:MAG: VIT domain-containing protein, partial [Limisphaerales bacterium]